MVFQGQVCGTAYPIIQQAYDEPINGTKKCKICGHLFVPNKGQVYCSPECKVEAKKKRQQKYARKKRGL